MYVATWNIATCEKLYKENGQKLACDPPTIAMQSANVAVEGPIKAFAPA
jgi:hypothetical protein